MSDMFRIRNPCVLTDTLSFRSYDIDFILVTNKIIKQISVKLYWFMMHVLVWLEDDSMISLFGKGKIDAKIQYLQERRYKPLNDSVDFPPPSGESHVRFACLAKFSIFTPTPPNTENQRKL